MNTFQMNKSPENSCGSRQGVPLSTQKRILEAEDDFHMSLNIANYFQHVPRVTLSYCKKINWQFTVDNIVCPLLV